MATTPISVRKLQRKLYKRSKQKPKQRFYSLYDKLYRDDVMATAYKRCRANGGAAGIDGVTFRQIERTMGVEAFLERLKIELKEKCYRPQAVKRVMIPKGDGGKRPLGLAMIRDRVVQMAVTIVMQPVFEPHLYCQSYGYRPKRSAQQAVRTIDTYLGQGYRHVLDADLSGYFDTIPHAPLLEKVTNRISDRGFLGLLKKIIKAPISVEVGSGKRRLIANHRGTPQGAVCSPLLANIYLNDFCQLIGDRTPCQIVTYADDFVILHKKPFTKIQLDWIARKLAEEGLTLNQEKTHCVDMGKLGNEFDFLGFNFKYIKGYYRNTRYLKIQPSKRSQHKLKEKLRDIVKHRTSRTLEKLIVRVNPIIRGWRNYFSQVGYPRQVFFKMDWFLVARFYRWSRSRSQRQSLYLTQDAWVKLRKAGLTYLLLVETKHCEGAK